MEVFQVHSVLKLFGGGWRLGPQDRKRGRTGQVQENLAVISTSVF